MEKTMSNKVELNGNNLEKVTGGRARTINTGVDGLKAALRNAPSKSSKQIAALANGTEIDTISEELVYDPVSGRNFVEVMTTDGKTGWIAASIVGLPR